MVQGNIWISNNSRLIMVTIYCNQYRSMVCLNMMFLQQKNFREGLSKEHRNLKQEGMVQ